jgi:putative transposase
LPQRLALCQGDSLMKPARAAFSVSQSKLSEVKAYTSRQEKHHRKLTYQQEVVALLKKHGVAFDPRFVV